MIDAYLEKTDTRTLAAGVIVIVVLVCAVQVLYLLWPQWQRYRQVDESREILARISAGGAGLATQLQAIEGEVAGLAKRLHGDMAELPAKQMESYIIGRLQRVSWNTDVDLISIKPGVGQQVQMFQEGLFDVELRAGYHDFVTWLQRINDELGFIVVKKYHIAPFDRQLTDAVLNIRLTMVAYRMVN
ncbi:MAG: type 4a pilus biogenesis protein PilO [Gammaproteobacteria bacterium]|nr:type 4a pilus biogenesis protein PilO [Gammaproteobacteria bacterium]